MVHIIQQFMLYVPVVVDLNGSPGSFTSDRVERAENDNFAFSEIFAGNEIELEPREDGRSYNCNFVQQRSSSPVWVSSQVL